MKAEDKQKDPNRRNAYTEAANTEGKQLDKSLRDLRGLEPSILSAIPHAVIGLKGRIIVFANEAVKTVFGWKPEELIGRNTRIFYRTEREYEEIDKHFYPTVQTRQTYSQEFPCRRKDGKEIVCRVRAAPVGRSLREKQVVAIYEDVTEQNRAKELLFKSEEKFRSIFENAAEGIFQSTPKWRFINVNLALAEMMGFGSPRDIINAFHDITQIPYVNPGDQTTYKKLLEAHGIIKGFETPIYRKDKRKIWISINARAVRDQHGKLLRYEGTVIDITSRKFAEKALRRSEERFRELYDSAPVGYHELDIEGRIKSVNQTELEMLGYTSKEMLGQPVWKFIGEEETSRKAVLAKLTGKLPPVKGFERLYMRKNGTTFPALVEDRILRNEEGQIVGIRSTIEDITERKRIEEEIEKHRGQLEQLVAERTAELMQANEKLQREITQRKIVVNELRASKEDLENKSRTLEELNTALRVLLQQRGEDRKDLEERFASNIKSLVLPYVEKMKKGRLDTRQHSCLSIIEANLNEIVSPFLHNIRQSNLTPREIQVASLVKDGKTTKEIAEIIGVGSSAIDSYRKSIRNKLKLSNQKTNLQSYLQSIT